jgi:hypothetical protein
VEIDQDIVRRVLAKYYRPGDSGPNGPSWLTFIAHAKDSLWSVDFFRCESILLCSHWVMVVMDLFTRRIVGFGVESGDIDGVSACRMFNRASSGQSLPKHVSTDHDPLFRFHRWLANLRVLAIEEVKSVPYAPRCDAPPLAKLPQPEKPEKSGFLTHHPSSEFSRKQWPQPRAVP